MNAIVLTTPETPRVQPVFSKLDKFFILLVLFNLLVLVNYNPVFPFWPTEFVGLGWGAFMSLQ